MLSAILGVLTAAGKRVDVALAATSGIFRPTWLTFSAPFTASAAANGQQETITTIAMPAATPGNDGYMTAAQAAAINAAGGSLAAVKAVLVARLDITASTTDLSAIAPGTTLTFLSPPFALSVPATSGANKNNAYAWIGQLNSALTGSGIAATVIGDGLHVAFEYAGTLTVQADATATAFGITNSIVGTVDWTVSDPTQIPSGQSLTFSNPDQSVAIPVAAAALPGGAAAWLAAWNDGRLPSGTVASLTSSKYLTFTRSSALAISDDKASELLGFTAAADNILVNISVPPASAIRVMAQKGPDGGQRLAFGLGSPGRLPTLSGSCGGDAGPYSVGLALVSLGLAVKASSFKLGGYADLYVSGGGGTQTLTTALTYYKVTQWTNAGPTAGDVTASTGASTITVGSAGVYEVAAGMSIGGTNNDQYTGKVYVNGNASNIGGQSTLNANGDGKELTMFGRLTLAAGDVLDVRATANNNTASLSVPYGRFSVRSV